MKSGNEPLLWIHTLGIKLDIGFLYGIIILLVLVSSSNAVNITDGLDGLAGNTVEAADMPTVKMMMENGAWTLQARSILPSSSACNWASMYMDRWRIEWEEVMHIVVIMQPSWLTEVASLSVPSSTLHAIL